MLYGTASPGEALEAATLQLSVTDLDAFLRKVAANAHFAGIDGVRYLGAEGPVQARADEYSLEDVITHILRNAHRYRAPESPITIALMCVDSTATGSIHNQGPPIDPKLVGRIFEYGVSDPGLSEAPEHRGQGLFVAKTYMAKMGGTIAVENTGGGVRFSLSLQRVG